MEALHRALPQAAVTNAYGTTEAGPVVFGPHPKGLPQPEMSVGYPHPQVQLRLVDGDNRNAEQGVLEMKCPAVMLGYHNRPDVTPPITPDGFYITGDVFRRDADGFHYFVGRTDDMFVSGGENIYPADVERMLERHPDVAQAAVVPIDDDIKGQKPVAFVIRKAGRAPSRGRDQALRARQRAGLSASALRLVRRRAAARLDQQGRPRRAAPDGRTADGRHETHPLPGGAHPRSGDLEDDGAVFIVGHLHNPRSRTSGTAACARRRCSGRAGSASDGRAACIAPAPPFDSFISTSSTSLPGASPVRLATRKIWVSTAMVGSPKATFSTTLAVLRPTPGSASQRLAVVRHLAAMLFDQHFATARSHSWPCRDKARWS